MDTLLDPQFGEAMVGLMAALVLVLQIAMAGQKWLQTNIRVLSAQVFILAAMANTIAFFRHAPHQYATAILLLMVKAVIVPLALKRLAGRIAIRQEIRTILRPGVSIVISGILGLIGYVVAESLHPKAGSGGAVVSQNALAVTISLFLTGFFAVINRREGLAQVVALLSLENGILVAAILLAYNATLIVELSILLDLVVAAMVWGILMYRMGEAPRPTNVGRLWGLGE